MFDEIFSFYGAFQIVCFSFLMFYIVKIVKQYITPELQREVVRKFERFKILNKEKKHLEIICKESEGKTKEEGIQAQILLNKVRLWHEIVGKKFQHHEEQRIESQERVKEYLQKQSELLAIDHTKLEIIPEALIEVKTELEQKFASSQEQVVFLEKIIETFDKGNR